MTLKKFLFREIETKRRIIFLLIVFLILSLIDIDMSSASFIGKKEKAVLSLSPLAGSFKVGEEFSVDVFLDTGGYNVVAVGAYLSFNPKYLKVIKIDTKNSIFNTNNPCSYNGSPCEIINYDNDEGKIEIVKAKPTPGVNTKKGLVATIHFLAKREIQPEEDNLTFNFISAFAKDDCDVILDDGKGTDILSGVNNARYVILPSGGGVVLFSSDTAPPSIKEINVSVKETKATISWKTSEPSISWIVYGTTTEYGKEEKILSFATSHSITLKNLSPSTTYHYQIKSKDKAGNIGYFVDKTFTTLAPKKAPSISDQQLELEKLRAKIKSLLIQIIQVLQAIILQLEERLKGQNQ